MSSRCRPVNTVAIRRGQVRDAARSRTILLGRARTLARGTVILHMHIYPAAFQTVNDNERYQRTTAEAAHRHRLRAPASRAPALRTHTTLLLHAAYSITGPDCRAPHLPNLSTRSQPLFRTTHHTHTFSNSYHSNCKIQRP